MSGDDVVRDHTNHSYLRLSGDAAESAAELASSEMEFGVLVDPAGHPRMLLTRDGRTAPAVVIDAGDPMDRVLAGDIVSMLNSGVPGLVVTDDSRITGVLSASAVIDYLVEHSPVRSGFLGDDGRLHGDAPVTPLKLICSTCKTMNTVVFFVAGEAQCLQGHPLTQAWD
jgi:hypothetical protein